MPIVNTLALYAVRLINELAARNIATYPLMQQAKLTPEELEHKENQIPQSKYIELVKQVTLNKNIEPLGFEVGQHTSMLEHGIISYAMLSCNTLCESIQRFEKYQNLIGPALSIKLTIEGDHAVLSAIPVPHIKWLQSGVLQYFTQEWLACIMQWQKFIDCPDNWFSHIKFGFPEHHKTYYQQHLDCSFEFNHNITQLFFPKKYLDLAMNFADHETNELCVNQCEKLLKDQEVKSELTTEIHRILSKSPSNALSIKEMAAELFITPRTMHRRLLKENTNYQQIVITFRISLAKRYLLETNLPINEISMLVGYADHSNFYRTFRKTLSLTPHQFRQETSNLAA